MAIQLTFEITLRSDYHISAGHGLGSLVDSALQRDVDGVPVVRGTTLTGLLRDGLLRLLQLPVLVSQQACQASGRDASDPQRYCGQKTPKQPDCPACRIFGSPRTPRHWRISAARPVDLPQLLAPQEGWQAGETASLIAPHVRVSPRTRRAEARKLFFREEGDARLRFRFTVVSDHATETTLSEAEWLVAAARNVRHLGANRRRGRGECRLHLVNLEVDGLKLPVPAELAGEQDSEYPYEAWLLERFRRRQLQNQPPSPLDVTLAALTASKDAAAVQAGPVRLRLIARLDEPLIISGKAEAGNEFQTVDYIPGPALRGALATRAAARYGLSISAGADYAAFVDIFFRQQVSFSPLYPALAVGNAVQPALPAPLDVLSCEIYTGYAVSDDSAAHGAWGYARSDDPELECHRCASAMKPLGRYLALQPRPTGFAPVHVTEMHVQIDPSTQRAASGNLFGFDALAAGQYFLGTLTCGDSAAWDELRRLTGLPNQGSVTLRMGKASRRGYGHVTLWIEALGADAAHPWVHLPLEQRVELTRALTLTLLTDAILVDRWGRFQTDLTPAWLEEQLGRSVTVIRSFCAARAVDSFNAHLGLPRWRDVALAAGSVVGFQVDGSLSEDEKAAIVQRLRSLEHEGIGLRRHEGFGQLVFNHPLNGRWLPGQSGEIDLHDGHVRLPLEMRLRTGDGHGHSLAQEASFRQRWEDMIADERYWRPTNGSFAHEEFETVARLLRTERPGSVQAVEDLIANLGKIGQLLPPPAALELDLWAEAKMKVNFFQSDKKPGRHGLDDLKALVDELAALTTEGSRQWHEGLEVLADRIAATAHAKATADQQPNQEASR